MRNLRRTHLGLLVVVIVFAILMFIVLTAVGVLLFTTQLRPARPVNLGFITFSSPLDVEQVDPALALASLGGVPGADLITEAAEKSRPETALAETLFQPQLSDTESAGSFLLLAPIYAERGEQEKSLFCYRMAGIIATLSPELPTTTRADLFFQVSEGLMAFGENESAKFYLDQAFVLALRSPFLQRVHRRQIFEQLQRNYIALGERGLARRSLDLSANPPDLEFLADEGFLITAGQPVVLPPDVQEAEAHRWLRAQELAAILVERGGNAPAEVYEALHIALLEEDAQKMPFYETELAAEAQLSRKIDLILAQIDWLSIKYRVARQGYGLSLVPEWDEQPEKIRADLTKAYEALFALYADLMVTLPTAGQIDRGTAEKLRREVLAGELGRYPNYPEQQRKKQLLEAMAKLIATQPELNIYVDLRQIGDEELFTLTSPTAITEE